jgi:hypothetical protein
MLFVEGTVLGFCEVLCTQVVREHPVGDPVGDPIGCGNLTFVDVDWIAVIGHPGNDRRAFSKVNVAGS